MESQFSGYKASDTPAMDCMNDFNFEAIHVCMYRNQIQWLSVLSNLEFESCS